jgi:hypothetical protein
MAVPAPAWHASMAAVQAGDAFVEGRVRDVRRRCLCTVWQGRRCYNEVVTYDQLTMCTATIG